MIEPLGLAPEDAARLERRRRVLARLARVLVDAARLPFEPDDLDPDVHLFGAGLGLDSIDALEVVVAVEREFQTRLVSSREHPALALRSVNVVVDRLLELGVEG